LFVNRTIDISQIDVEVVDRSRQSHWDETFVIVRISVYYLMRNWRKDEARRMHFV
jgi:hypothetical protein